MKTIGLIGGISWESTATYYRAINELTRERLGGLHSAPCLLWSFDFHEIETRQQSGEWAKLTRLMIAAAKRLAGGGADFLLICANTMHRMADEVEVAVDVPLLHIADATGGVVRATGLHTVGLLGTRYTMEQDFYCGRLEERHGLRVITPVESDRQIVHDVIYQELCTGHVTDASREQYRAIIQRLVDAGAEGVILGCTEIGILIGPDDSPVPLFDTTHIHAAAAVEFALTE